MKSKPVTPQKAANTFPDPSNYTADQTARIREKNNDWQSTIKNKEDLAEILGMARQHCKETKFVTDGLIFPCKNGKPKKRPCVPASGKPGKTSQAILDAVAEQSGSKIDWERVGDQEGGQHLNAYVPWIVEFQSKKVGDGVQDIYVPVIELKNGRVKGMSQSGVTVATGFDLGAQGEDDLKRLGLSQALIEKLKPYLGKMRAAACKALRERPLTLTKEEADEIDGAVKAEKTITTASEYKNLRNAYNRRLPDTPMRKWSDLSEGEQTALASRKYQDGNITGGSNRAIAEKIGVGDAEGAKDGYRQKSGYARYKSRYESEIRWLPQG